MCLRSSNCVRRVLMKHLLCIWIYSTLKPVHQWNTAGTAVAKPCPGHRNAVLVIFHMRTILIRYSSRRDQPLFPNIRLVFYVLNRFGYSYCWVLLTVDIHRLVLLRVAGQSVEGQGSFGWGSGVSRLRGRVQPEQVAGPSQSWRPLTLSASSGSVRPSPPCRFWGFTLKVNTRN